MVLLLIVTRAARGSSLELIYCSICRAQHVDFSPICLKGHLCKAICVRFCQKSRAPPPSAAWRLDPAGHLPKSSDLLAFAYVR